MSFFINNTVSPLNIAVICLPRSLVLYSFFLIEWSLPKIAEMLYLLSIFLPKFFCFVFINLRLTLHGTEVFKLIFHSFKDNVLYIIWPIRASNIPQWFGITLHYHFGHSVFCSSLFPCWFSLCLALVGSSFIQWEPYVKFSSLGAYKKLYTSSHITFLI